MENTLQMRRLLPSTLVLGIALRLLYFTYTLAWKVIISEEKKVLGFDKIKAPEKNRRDGVERDCLRLSHDHEDDLVKKIKEEL